MIITQDWPTTRAIHPRTWIKQTDHPVQEFNPSLHIFAAQRTALLALLPLAPHDWFRGATVSGAGKPLERTVKRCCANTHALHKTCIQAKKTS